MKKKHTDKPVIKQSPTENYKEAAETISTE